MAALKYASLRCWGGRMRRLSPLHPPAKERLDYSFVGWTAGILDGEGCISIRRPDLRGRHGRASLTYSPEMRVKMTHKTTIERLTRLVPCAALNRCKPGRNNKRICRRWDTSHFYTEMCLRAMSPFFLTKCLEAITAFRFTRTFSDTAAQLLDDCILAKRERLYLQMRRLKTLEWIA
jgi:hypothetical protein